MGFGSARATQHALRGQRSPHAPIIRCDKVLAQKAGPPCLKQPPWDVASVRLTDARALSLLSSSFLECCCVDMPRESGRIRALCPCCPVLSAPCVRRSVACWGQGQHEHRHLAVDTDATRKNTRTRTHCTRCTAPRLLSRRLDPSYHAGKVHTGSQLPLPPSLRLLRLPLHHLSRPKSRQPGTATSDIVSYSTAAAITVGRLRAPGLSSLCSPTSFSYRTAAR